MLMNEYDDAYVDAMLMVDMQANTRSVTIFILDFNQDVVSDSHREPNGLVRHLQSRKCREQSAP